MGKCMAGIELRRLRIERGLNPTELARLSQVSRARIYAIENGVGGHPTLDTLHKLAQGLSAWLTAFTERGDRLHWTDEYPEIKRRNRRVN